MVQNHAFATTPMGKDTSYAGNHLNRQTVDEMNQAKAQQELNAIQTMERLAYLQHAK